MQDVGLSFLDGGGFILQPMRSTTAARGASSGASGIDFTDPLLEGVGADRPVRDRMQRQRKGRFPRPEKGPAGT
jgi:hypothetical protein